MSISSVSNLLGASTLTGFSSAPRQNKPASMLQSDLDGIREKGLRAWAHEQQLEKLKARLRDEILSDKKLRESDLAAMPTDVRNSFEAEIQKLIEQKLQEAVQTAVEDASSNGKTQAILVDISV